MNPFEIAGVAAAAIPSYLLVAVLVGRSFDYVMQDHKTYQADRMVILGLVWPFTLPLLLTAVVLSTLFVAVEWGMGRPNPTDESQKEETT